MLLDDVAQGSTDTASRWCERPTARCARRSARSPTRAASTCVAAPLDLGTTWHHVALTRTDTHIAFYVDGDARGGGARRAGDDAATRPTAGTSAPSSATTAHGSARSTRSRRTTARSTPQRSARTRASARTAQPPVTRTSPPFAAFHAPTSIVHFVTDKGGSTFRCGLDGAPLAPCRQQHQMTNLAAARTCCACRRPTASASSRRRRPSCGSPSTRSCRTRSRSSGSRPTATARRSSRWAPTSRVRRTSARPTCPASRSSRRACSPDFFFSPVRGRATSPRGARHRVRAVDVAGNRDPIGDPRLRARRPARVSRAGVRPADVRGRARRGRHRRPAALRGARDAVRVPHRRRAWARCPFAFRLPILHAGPPHAAGPPAPRRHERRHDDRRARDDGRAVDEPTRRSSACRPRSSSSAASALSRRAPRLRFALNRPAALRVEIVRGGKPARSRSSRRGAIGPERRQAPGAAARKARRPAATGSSSRRAGRRDPSRPSACRWRSSVRCADARRRLALVLAHPFADRVVRHAVPAADRRVARLLISRRARRTADARRGAARGSACPCARYRTPHAREQ